MSATHCSSPIDSQKNQILAAYGRLALAVQGELNRVSQKLTLKHPD